MKHGEGEANYARIFNRTQAMKQSNAIDNDYSIIKKDNVNWRLVCLISFVLIVGGIAYLSMLK